MIRRATTNLRGRGIAVVFAFLSACAEDPSDPGATPIEPDPRATMSTSNDEGGTGIVVNATGVYMIGRTNGALDGPNQGGDDVFVRKYHPEGEFLWGEQFGSPGTDDARGIAVDDGGYLYVVGETTGSVAGTRGGSDAFIRRYSPDGSPLWTRQFGTPVMDGAYDVTVGPTGDAYVVGHTAGSLARTHTSGDADAFVRRYDPSGGVVWTRQFGSGEADVARGVAVDDSGIAYVVGWTDGDVRGTNAGSQDVFLRAYGAEGTVLWTRQYGTTGVDAAEDVVVDNARRVIVVGATSGALFDSIVGGTLDGFVMKLSSNGNLVYAQHIRSEGEDLALDVSVDQIDQFYVTGHTRGTLEQAPNGLDAFVRKYSSTNSVVWTRQIDSGGITPYDTHDDSEGVASHFPGEVYFTGLTSGVLGSSNSGGSDAFLRRLDTNGDRVWTDQ